MNPLLKISVGLNMLLANADLETQMDDKERQNLFHMALICNLAVSALDDIAMKDDHGSVHSESRSGIVNPERNETTMIAKYFSIK